MPAKDLCGRALISDEVWKMKTVFVWTAVTALAVAAHGQSAGGSEYAAAQGGQASAPAAQGIYVAAELSKKLDTGNAKVGDPVVAKTTADAQLADGTKLPKGSKLVGRVTDVLAKSHDHHDSHLTFVFDHAALKDGRELPVRTSVQALSAPAPVAASSSDDMMASNSSPGGDSMVRGGGSSHGNAGGVSGAVPGTAGTTAGGLASNVTSGAAMNGSGNATGNLGANGTPLNSTAGLNAGLAGQAMPVGNLYGVTFSTVSSTAGSAAADASNGGASSSAGSSTATMLTGHGRNVSLESGSQITLSVAPQ
jgi:hypothetical protein